MFGRNKVAMLVAEFLGTATLATIVLSVANSRIGFPLFIAAAAGLTVGLYVLLVGKNSGAHLNPAITLGLWSMRKVSTTQAIAYIAAQLVGGVAALGLYQWLTGSTLTNIAGQNFSWQVFTAEAVGAFVFGFGVAAALSQKYDNWTLAVATGSALTLGMITASIAANALVNPAVAVGVRSISRAYIAGPLVGAVVGMNLYQYLFAPAPARAARVATKPAARSTRRRAGGRRSRR